MSYQVLMPRSQDHFPDNQQIEDSSKEEQVENNEDPQVPNNYPSILVQVKQLGPTKIILTKTTCLYKQQNSCEAWGKNSNSSDNFETGSQSDKEVILQRFNMGSSPQIEPNLEMLIEGYVDQSQVFYNNKQQNSKVIDSNSLQKIDKHRSTRIKEEVKYFPGATHNIYKAFHGGLIWFMKVLPEDIKFTKEAENFLNTPKNRLGKIRLSNSIKMCSQIRSFANEFFCNYQWTRYFSKNNKIDLDSCFRLCPLIIAQILE
ncbi:unnamed protein product (macronuclear) [Paramecium tetraurelia]|uniref:PiggyBac transposable element-derived protein domain-containing protein n=1 Tax=Paramecium tetraurelia TaxID=5888 RepID=A0DU42_PARTE|nr:uncharacterized protein GSPATT00020230001 [Paramecium tetraurelia]CAK86559.1 unnamed protein product [Paramecium tetraurelia]|eukprot:XP_001453956.1 hypothetical protein (macronuclear) [Paramecium tetraurelia strain d4-2]